MTYLQNARSRERMSLLLAKAKNLMTPPAAATAVSTDGEASAAAADGAESAAAANGDESSSMSAAEKLAIIDEYLKQLGTRPLAAALQDLNKLVAAAGTCIRPIGCFLHPADQAVLTLHKFVITPQQRILALCHTMSPAHTSGARILAHFGR